MKSISTNEQKKTNYPDLERLPNTNFWKHLLNYIWNEPRWMFENFCDKCFFTIKKCKKRELEFIEKELFYLDKINKLESEKLEREIQKK